MHILEGLAGTAYFMFMVESRSVKWKMDWGKRIACDRKWMKLQIAYVHHYSFTLQFIVMYVLSVFQTRTTKTLR